jgi:hypothetical protein
VTQAVEHLPSEHKAMSSNPSTIKRKKIMLRAGGAAQAVECLTSKHEASSPNHVLGAGES